MGRAAAALFARRLAVFLLAAVLIRLVSEWVDKPVNGLPLLLLALLVSSPFAILLSRTQRATLAEAVAQRQQAKAEEIAERRARLDRES